MFVQELAATHAGIPSVCAACLADAAEDFERDLETAMAKYAPRAPFSPRSVAEHLTAVMQGDVILAKAKQDRGVIGESLLHYRHYLKSLFKK